jgi:hypothetical protein
MEESVSKSICWAWRQLYREKSRIGKKKAQEMHLPEDTWDSRIKV